MKIAIASDHAGFEMKEFIKTYLITQNHDVKDFGAFNTDSMDYPDSGFPCAEAVANQEFEKGILICGSGIGMSIVANKVKGIRAALCHSVEYARLAREHNDANVLVIGGRFTSQADAELIVDTWLHTAFSNDPRHQRRIDKINK